MCFSSDSRVPVVVEKLSFFSLERVKLVLAWGHSNPEMEKLPRFVDLAIIPSRQMSTFLNVHASAVCLSSSYQETTFEDGVGFGSVLHYVGSSFPSAS